MNNYPSQPKIGDTFYSITAHELLVYMGDDGWIAAEEKKVYTGFEGESTVIAWDKPPIVEYFKLECTKYGFVVEYNDAKAAWRIGMEIDGNYTDIADISEDTLLQRDAHQMVDAFLEKTWSQVEQEITNYYRRKE